MNCQSKENSRSLYRFEYYEPEDDFTYVDWVWLDVAEIADYKSGLSNVNVRPATKEESDLYDEAYADGYGVAALIEFDSKYDGVTFRIELTDDGELSTDKKMFQCAICDEHLDFELRVAAIGEMYLGVIKDDKLWHVCKSCT